ncbi:DUF1080 domain-containing protein [Cytophaga sp. FL35]|uniref:3-keto-disaccharide hydrolase n=1 Tax=Cytophaga sp. FL35 TaxID=1904456 RepID=UPI0025709AD7|nr:DUF1080 domain-containing protein [Cytophaga sp. FL35]
MNYYSQLQQSLHKRGLFSIIDPIFQGVSVSMVLILLLSCTTVKGQKTEVLFDGVSMKGWKVLNARNAKFWAVMDSTLVGGDGHTKIPENTYLHTLKEYQDFELRFLFRITGDHSTGLINSGVQYRSTIKDGHIIGYQADIGKGYWGDIYDEHRRGKLVDGDLSILKHLLKEDGWNSYIVRCKGNRHELYINGVKTADYVEKDAAIPNKGVIGIQVHSGGNAMVEFKELTLTAL